MCWRIVRVTGDGSIKLVLYNYNPNEVANPCDISQDGTTNAFARYSGATYTTAFNTNFNYNAHVGFMYGAPGSASYALEHANTNKSTILINLETWYTNKLSSYANKLADTIWCNDKKIDTIYPYGTTLGYGTNQTGYGARERIYAGGAFETNASPSLICQNDSNGGKLSKFTADEMLYGNGNLTYRIGLLTADEIAYAGATNYKSGFSNNTFYLYKNVNNGGWWWSLSSVDFYATAAEMYCVFYGTCLNNNYVGDVGGLRPAVSLLPTVTVTGLGTSANPYIVGA